MSQPIAIGTYVLYGKTGVCQVQEYKDVRIGRETCSYYVLAPVSDGRSSVYVPRDNAELVARMRPLLTREEIHTLLAAVDAENQPWLEDRNARTTLYRAVMTEGDRCRLIRVIGCLYRKKHERMELGKRLSMMDESALQECTRLIDEEFSLVLEIPRSEVPNYILEHV